MRRMKGKLGKAEGTTTAAHKLARIVHGMIKSQKPSDEKEAFKLTPQSEARRRKALEKQAAALGFTLQPAAYHFKLVGRFKDIQSPINGDFPSHSIRGLRATLAHPDAPALRLLTARLAE